MQEFIDWCGADEERRGAASPDKKGAGLLTRMKAGALESAFRSFDNSDDGSIDYEEFIEGLKNIGVSMPAEDWKKLCAAIDPDGDRTINYAEFIHWMGDGSLEQQRVEVQVYRAR